jgi:hypothetical protein
VHAGAHFAHVAVHTFLGGRSRRKLITPLSTVAIAFLFFYVELVLNLHNTVTSFFADRHLQLVKTVENDDEKKNLDLLIIFKMWVLRAPTTLFPTVQGISVRGCLSTCHERPIGGSVKIILASEALQGSNNNNDRP